MSCVSNFGIIKTQKICIIVLTIVAHLSKKLAVICVLTALIAMWDNYKQCDYRYRDVLIHTMPCAKWQPWNSYELASYTKFSTENTEPCLRFNNSSWHVNIEICTPLASYLLYGKLSYCLEITKLFYSKILWCMGLQLPYLLSLSHHQSSITKCHF